jgi:acyl-CoA reductase-like NAD-dependent aldehyde dehydrogenase
MPDTTPPIDVAGALRREFRLLIGGELVPASDGAKLKTFNPATGEFLAEVPNAGPADVDRAVAAARAAHPGWRSLDYGERRAAVLRLGQILRTNAELYGLLDTLDSGNILSAMRVDALGAADMIDYYASIGFEIKGEVTHLDRNLHYTKHQPFGVVARLLPFNHPIAAAGTALAPPLLTGNCLILKPSPHTPLSALAFAEAARDALPPGVLTILTGDNDRVSAPLVRHPGVDRIALTGSVEAGRAVMRMASDRLAPVTLELGGKNPLVIFPDFDPDAAADIAVAAMNFAWQSHSCASTSRILVHQSIEAAFLERLADKVGKIRVRNPLSPDAQMGAITYQSLYQRCLRYLESGQAQGAKLIVGGERPKDPALRNGLFMTPAVLAQAKPHMDIARDEIFGPIISVMSWNDYDTMVKIANELPFGLTAVIATNDLNAAHRTADVLEAGYVEVNGAVSFALGSPYGGIKQSGIGREGCLEELLSYTRTKSINVRLSHGRIAPGQ